MRCNYVLCRTVLSIPISEVRMVYICNTQHSIPETSENLRVRLCSFCDTNEIGNKIHFLFFCEPHNSWRIKLFNEITEKYAHFKELDTPSKILFLFNGIDPTVCLLLLMIV